MVIVYCSSLALFEMQEDVYMSNLFKLMTQFRLVEACQLCHEHRDHRLALFLAQAASGLPDSRVLVRQQLAEWEKFKVSKNYI